MSLYATFKTVSRQVWDMVPYTYKVGNNCVLLECSDAQFAQEIHRLLPDLVFDIAVTDGSEMVLLRLPSGQNIDSRFLVQKNKLVGALHGNRAAVSIEVPKCMLHRIDTIPAHAISKRDLASLLSVFATKKGR